jgi:hypothetical protein
MFLRPTGNVRPQAKKKSPVRGWDDTKASSQVTTCVTLGFHEIVQWRIGECTISQSGDECSEGSWVFIHQPGVRVEF